MVSPVAISGSGAAATIAEGRLRCRLDRYRDLFTKWRRRVPLNAVLASQILRTLKEKMLNSQIEPPKGEGI